MPYYSPVQQTVPVHGKPTLLSLRRQGHMQMDQDENIYLEKHIRLSKLYSTTSLPVFLCFQCCNNIFLASDYQVKKYESRLPPQMLHRGFKWDHTSFGDTYRVCILFPQPMHYHTRRETAR